MLSYNFQSLRKPPRVSCTRTHVLANGCAQDTRCIGIDGRRRISNTEWIVPVDFEILGSRGPVSKLCARPTESLESRREIPGPFSVHSRSVSQIEIRCLRGHGRESFLVQMNTGVRKNARYVRKQVSRMFCPVSPGTSVKKKGGPTRI